MRGDVREDTFAYGGRGTHIPYTEIKQYKPKFPRWTWKQLRMYSFLASINRARWHVEASDDLGGTEGVLVMREMSGTGYERTFRGGPR